MGCGFLAQAGIGAFSSFSGCVFFYRCSVPSWFTLILVVAGSVSRDLPIRVIDPLFWRTVPLIERLAGMRSSLAGDDFCCHSLAAGSFTTHLIFGALACWKHFAVKMNILMTSTVNWTLTEFFTLDAQTFHWIDSLPVIDFDCTK